MELKLSKRLRLPTHACVMPYAGSHGGGHVEVEGSFDNWTTRQVLQRSGKESTIVKLLPPGVYQVGALVVWLAHRR